jgi:hypothetical protein
MDKSSLKNYIRQISSLLIDNAKQAKLDADHPKEGDSVDFNEGYLMAYHQVIATMKNQASFFDLGQEDIGLAGVEPERDLI